MMVSHKGFVTSGPSNNGVLLGKEAEGMDIPLGERAALRQYNTIIKHVASGKTSTPKGAMGGVPPCLPRLLNNEADFGFTTVYMPDPKR